MRSVLAFVLLSGLAAVNLVLNLEAPSGVKLVLVPVASLVVILLIAAVFRRRAHDGRSPPR